jgi:hypothetical protein
MALQGLALRHEAADTLADWARFGCPTCTGWDWTLAEIDAAIARGLHQSALDPEAIAHFEEEVTTKLTKGQAHVVLWDEIRSNRPRQLKVSPVAAIPHKSVELLTWSTTRRQSWLPEERSTSWDICLKG